MLAQNDLENFRVHRQPCKLMILDGWLPCKLMIFTTYIHTHAYCSIEYTIYIYSQLTCFLIILIILSVNSFLIAPNSQLTCFLCTIKVVVSFYTCFLCTKTRLSNLKELYLYMFKLTLPLAKNFHNN